MKSHRVWAELSSLDNVWAGWREFSKGKRRRPAVAWFYADAERQVLRLHRELATGAWAPRRLRILRINDPKRRIVAAAHVRDRVVHHAIHRVLAPRLNRRLIHHTYACLPGRGSHRAVLAFQRAMRKHRFVLQLDIRRYFYSIDRERLRAWLWHRLPEEELRGLLGRVLAHGSGLYRRPAVAGWLGWDGPNPRGRGLPIGNLTSQWWGNLVLDELDHRVCRHLRLGHYQRYMDDFTLFGQDRSALVGAREDLSRWLAVQRGLKLKDPAAMPQSTHRPAVYLGHRITRESIRLGPKARGRLPGNLGGAADDPERARAVAAAWKAAAGFPYL